MTFTGYQKDSGIRGSSPHFPTKNTNLANTHRQEYLCGIPRVQLKRQSSGQRDVPLAHDFFHGEKERAK